MAKYYGAIGYAETVETSPDVWEDQIVERRHSGDVIRNTRRNENGESTNDNLVLNNNISIIADAYANLHFFAIRYVEWMGTKWKVTNVEVQPPRLLLTLGGVYNADTTTTIRGPECDSRF